VSSVPSVVIAQIPREEGLQGMVVGLEVGAVEPVPWESAIVFSGPVLTQGACGIFGKSPVNMFIFSVLRRMPFS
jgi:hypothetical protein